MRNKLTLDYEGNIYKIYNPLPYPVQIHLHIADRVVLDVGVQRPNRLKAFICGKFGHRWTYLYAITPAGNTVQSNLVCSRCRTLLIEEKP